MNISRIDLADATSPEKIIQALWKVEPDLPIPVPVENLCMRLDIVEINELETDGFEGGLITQQEKTNGIILYNKDSPYARRRFTIAHELGHFLMPHHIPNDDGNFLCRHQDMYLVSRREEDKRDRMEVEANLFAALLLMPPHRFQEDANKGSEPRIECIEGLAKKYRTSKDATSRAYVKYSRSPCAVVVGRNRKVLRHYRGPNFPDIDVRNGTEFPRNSLSSKSCSGHLGMSCVEEVDPEIWLKTDADGHMPKLYEQCLAQRDGYSLTLLSVEERDEDEEYEESMIKRSWQPPRFRR